MTRNRTQVTCAAVTLEKIKESFPLHTLKRETLALEKVILSPGKVTLAHSKLINMMFNALFYRL